MREFGKEVIQSVANGNLDAERIQPVSQSATSVELCNTIQKQKLFLKSMLSIATAKLLSMQSGTPSAYAFSKKHALHLPIRKLYLVWKNSFAR